MALENARRQELESFLVLAEELHFGRTAERLRVSTAQVSQTIRKLERRIGVPLFTSTSRRVELTPVGRQLLPISGRPRRRSRRRFSPRRSRPAAG